MVRWESVSVGRVLVRLVVLGSVRGCILVLCASGTLRGCDTIARHKRKVFLACTQIVVQRLRERLGDLHEQLAGELGLPVREELDQLGNKGDPVPDGRLAAVVVAGLPERALSVVAVEQPQDAHQNLACLGILVQTCGL